MEALLRQSRSMCPFLNNTHVKTLDGYPPGGGTVSNLQVIARRSPVMGKAMAVHSGKAGSPGLGDVFGCKRHCAVKAKIHTTRAPHAMVNIELLKHLREVPELGGSIPLSGKPPESATPGLKPSAPTTAKFDHEGFYNAELNKKHKDKSYRYFNNINRLAQGAYV